ncbi:MAG: hypothetical protein ACRD6B_06685, partial [Bryobacteraceae bacterium]
VLAPGGVFLVSTPNKIDYAEARQSSGPNPFHVHEFELAAFEEALSGVFPFVRILGQNRQEAMIFAGGHAGRAALGFIADRQSLEDAQFFLAVCAKEPVGPPPPYIYAGMTGNLLRERERWAFSLERELSGARSKIDDLHRELDDRTHWAKSLEGELAAAREKLQAAEARIARLMEERNLVRSSRWMRLGRLLNLGPDVSRDIT